MNTHIYMKIYIFNLFMCIYSKKPNENIYISVKNAMHSVCNDADAEWWL